MALEHDIQALGAHRCLLGESPLWHPTEQVLYAVDIPGRQVLRWREGADAPDIWPQSAEPGCIAARASGGLLVARRDGQTIYYGLCSGQARVLVETLSRLFCAPRSQTPSLPPLKEI